MLEGCGLLALPLRRRAKLMRHHRCDGWRGTAGGLCIDQQSAHAAREDVLKRSSHLVPDGVDDLSQCEREFVVNGGGEARPELLQADDLFGVGAVAEERV